MKPSSPATVAAAKDCKARAAKAALDQHVQQRFDALEMKIDRVLNVFDASKIVPAVTNFEFDICRRMDSLELQMQRLEALFSGSFASLDSMLRSNAVEIAFGLTESQISQFRSSLAACGIDFPAFANAAPSLDSLLEEQPEPERSPIKAECWEHATPHEFVPDPMMIPLPAFLSRCVATPRCLVFDMAKDDENDPSAEGEDGSLGCDGKMCESTLATPLSSSVPLPHAIRPMQSSDNPYADTLDAQDELDKCDPNDIKGMVAIFCRLVTNVLREDQSVDACLLEDGAPLAQAVRVE